MINDNGEEIGQEIDGFIDDYVNAGEALKADLQEEYVRVYKLATDSNSVIPHINGALKKGTSVMTLVAVALFTCLHVKPLRQML